jgi:hypothetical protein
MNDEQFHALHESIFERMLKADWLTSFSFTNDKGWHPTWTVKGAKQAAELRRIITVFGLDRQDQAAQAFSVLVQGGSAPGGKQATEFEGELARRWRQAIAELGIAVATEELSILVHIILTWGESRSHS